LSFGCSRASLSVGFRVVAWFAGSAHFWDDSLFSYLC